MPTRTIEEITAELRDRPIERSFVIERDAAVDEETRTVSLAFASDKPIDHWFGQLALTMTTKAMRSDRLKNGAALLMDHNSRDQIGVVENFTVDKGVARADVRFSDSTRGEEIFRDVKNGIRRNVSVGFMVHEMHLESEKKGEMPVYRSDDWEPYEISLVSIPADISVGVGRSKDPAPTTTVLDPDPAGERAHSAKTENTMPDPTIATPDAPVVEPPTVTRTAADIARESVLREIDAVAAAIGLPDAATKFHQKRLLEQIAGDPTVEEFKAFARTLVPASTFVPPADAATVAARNGAPTDGLARILPRHGRIHNFSGANEAEKAERAYRFGNWFLAGPMARKIDGSQLLDTARTFCKQNGLTRTINESVNADGGFLVPEEFGNDLIDLRERHGVFRQHARIVPMSSDRRTDPAISGFVPTYFPEEEGEITAGDLDFGQVGLTARKLAALVPISNEWNEDSIVSSGDLVAGEIGKAFAYKEDLCGFIGTGSSTYGRIVGLTEKLKGVDATIANIAGLKVGSGNAYSELTLADFEGTVALLPEFADTANAKWFVSRKFYYNVMLPLLLALGGTTPQDAENGRPRRFLGYDIVFAQVMPSVAANSQVCAVLGDLSMGVNMGSRHDTRIAVSEHSRFKYDMLEIRGTERFDINPHGVGTTTEAGPIVGLITAAS